MLTELFKTAERVKILYYIMYRDTFTASQVSKETGITKGLISRYLRYLNKHLLLTRSGNLYHLRDSARARAIKVLLNLDKIELGSLDLSWAAGLGIFGSWAQGANTYESDFDVWVKVEKYPSEYELARLQRGLQAMVNAEVNMLILTPEKIDGLKKADPPFYNSLVRTSMTLKGEPIE